MTGTGRRTTVGAGDSTVPERFDLLGELPTGTTMLEASAGTGKTFTIAALVARYVAEGVATMDQLLVVSFSRESARELRERVRERLVSVRDGLSDPSGGDPSDTVLGHIRTSRPDEDKVRLRRITDALALFDAATVSTTHGFCQQVLSGLGTAGDHDPDAVLVEDPADLVREVCDDLYLRKWAVPGVGKPDLTRAEFGALALDVVKDRATALVPPEADTGRGLRTKIGHRVRAEVERRKRRLRLFDYDDLLIRLQAALTDPEHGRSVCERLRERYHIVLVDEFQDTDPVQWDILRVPFHGHRTLVLIGDPKQAIYAFRGADVHAYLDARETAATIRTLPTSFRSDAAVLEGLEAVFRGAALGDERIRVVRVDAVNQGPMVQVAGASAPVRLRVLPRDDLELAQNGTVKTGPARAAVAHDLAAEVVDVLTGGTLVPRDGATTRPVVPGDIAVLVRTNNEALLVGEQLRRAGVPVVLTGRTSVFATPAADEWVLLLEALEQPHRTTVVRRFALGCFVGRTAADLAERGDQDAEDLALQLRVWGRVLEQRGLAALFEAVSVTHALQQRLLGQQDGERLLTDLRHLAQVLHQVTLEGQLGLTALAAWLRRRRDEAATEGEPERSRRLESDAAAVQVITVHTSKGLEFPVVMVPFGWNRWAGKEPSTAVFHDEDGRRVRDVGGKGDPTWTTNVARHHSEDADDELRLTYVGLTRAMAHLVLWWAPSYNTATAPLHRLLMNDDPSTVAPMTIKVPSDATALARLESRAADSCGGLAVEVMQPRAQSHWTPASHRVASLAAAELRRTLDHDWRRTSYSALTAAAHEEHLRFGSEPEVSPKDDEPAAVEAADFADPPDVTVVSGSADTDAGLLEVPSAWDELPGGPRFGTMVHAVIEHLPDAPDATAVAEVVAAQAFRGPPTDAASLTTALMLSMATPLGHLAAGASLSDIPLGDRLAELDFELPLAGGDEPSGAQPLLSHLVPLWREHCPSGPLAAYADALADLEPAPLRGYLAGSIDTVLRVGVPAAPRYLVVDYKTNRLGGFGTPLTAWDYRPEALRDAMIEAHYPLQALLYQVALHRFLRWRQRGYDPEVHLGGVLYLFLRGMSGKDVACADGSVPGVFAWRPAPALVTRTSDLLAGRS